MLQVIQDKAGRQSRKHKGRVYVVCFSFCQMFDLLSIIVSRILIGFCHNENIQAVHGLYSELKHK